MNYHSWVGNNAHCIPYLNKTMNSLFPHVVQCILHNIIERTYMINEFGSPNQSEFPCKKHFEDLLFIDYRFLGTFLCIDLKQFFPRKIAYLCLIYGILIYFIPRLLLTNDFLYFFYIDYLFIIRQAEFRVQIFAPPPPPHPYSMT